MNLFMNCWMLYLVSMDFFFKDVPARSHDEVVRQLFTHPKYDGDRVNCLHPRIIINPSLPELVFRYKTVVTPTKILHYKDVQRHYFFFNFNAYSVEKNKITYENYEDTYVLDELTGETFPVYLLVPCGHCDCCQKAKLDSMSHRCVLETMCYKSLPWFVTLTYAPEHLPSDGVRLDHVQLFLKRFRINLERAGYDKKIRYFLSSEYSPVRRPHYHIIFWNLHPIRNLGYYKIFKILQDSWSHGFVYNEIVSPYRKGQKYDSRRCFEYVAKYIYKGSDVPEGKNPTFYTSSNRGGGIAAPFLDKYVIPTIRHNLNHKFMYFDIFANEAKPLFFNRYVLNRCFPTFSQSVSLELRNAYKDLLLCNARLDYSYRQDVFREIYSILYKHLPSPGLTFADVSINEPSCLSHCPFMRYRFDQAVLVINKLLPLCDFEKSLELHEKRKLFISKLLQNHKKRDLEDIAYKFRLSKQKRDAMVYLPM